MRPRRDDGYYSSGHRGGTIASGAFPAPVPDKRRQQLMRAPNPFQKMVLKELAARQPIGPTDLAERLGRNAPPIVRAIHTLHERGLVRRNASNMFLYELA